MVTKLHQVISSISALKGEIQLRGTTESARSLVTALLSQNDPRPVLCIAGQEGPANQFADEIQFFCSMFSLSTKDTLMEREILILPPALPHPFGIHRPLLGSVQDRLRCLLALLTARAPVLVTSLPSLLQKVIPVQAVQRSTLAIRTGQTLEQEYIVGFLLRTGYRRVSLVERPGECAVRGGLVDVYPLTLECPVRIDFLGDSIETVRFFNPDTQRSMQRVTECLIPPAGMVLMEEGSLESARDKIKQRADQLDLPKRRRIELLQRIETGLPLPDQMSILPFFYPDLASIFEYLSTEVLVIALNNRILQNELEACWLEIVSSIEETIRKGSIIPAAEDLYLSPEALSTSIKNRTIITFHELPGFDCINPEGPVSDPYPAETSCGPGIQSISVQASRVFPHIAGSPEKKPKGLAPVLRAIREWTEKEQRVFLVCGSDPEQERMGKLLSEYDLPYTRLRERFALEEAPPRLYLIRGRISAGFSFPLVDCIFLHEEDIFGPKVHRPKESDRAFRTAPDIRELRPGDCVVHVDFGIGIYRGLETLDIRGFVNDYLHLEYANSDRLYLPVDRASRIQRYVGTDDTTPTLDKLGGTTWTRTKQKIKASIMEMAQELVSLYASRLIKKGFAFSKPDIPYQEFEALFPFEETPDQERAIVDVLRDMERDRPMDRLVCGDVGFGKTEVAIRAAFKAVMDGKQVAVLVPTTVLAQQHFVNFCIRFEGYPVSIDMLSRFRSRHEQQQIIKNLTRASLDIVIGTHRLLQKDVIFRDLGLLIVDEEQRFGVKQKERLKQFRTQVDVLTLTATPIPRTLHMSMLGLRDLSVINTPPQDRRAIETYLIPFDPDALRNAILRELSREGQVFFLHNQVHNIDSIAAKVKQIVPEARIAVAHGQMPERRLERIMLEFVEKKHDVLVCTTIIESGLDIPNANTIIIHRADRFGLAQLYQIRGRVGRSREQAYAFLIIPDDSYLTEEAQKRLEVLYEFTELGSGFRVARYDLEIRGAGNLLGASQSGHIKAVGYDLYMELMQKAIRESKGEEVLEEVDPEIHLDMPAYLPEYYIEDPTQRLQLYKRLASAHSSEDLEDLRMEVHDRYGPLPDLVSTLFEVMHFKVELRALRIREARFSEEGLMLLLDEHSPVNVDHVVEWITKEPERLRLFPDHRVWVRFTGGSPLSRLRESMTFLARLKEGQVHKAATG